MFLTVLFDSLTYKVIFFFLHLFSKKEKMFQMQGAISRKEPKKILTQFEPTKTLSLLFIISKSLWLTVLKEILFESMSATKI